jgi:hypothetical protein
MTECVKAIAPAPQRPLEAGGLGLEAADDADKTGRRFRGRRQMPHFTWRSLEAIRLSCRASAHSGK